MLSARQEFLLITLLNTAKPVETGWLCEKLSISQRTLREEMKEVNLFLSDYDMIINQTKQETFYIEQSEKPRLTKIMKNYENVCEWLPETPLQRHFIILFILLWRDKSVTMDEISEEIFVSRSSVFHDIKQLGEFVKNVTGQDLEIHKAKGIRFQATEELKRKLISALIYKHFRSDANYLMRIFKLFKLGTDEQYQELVHLYQKHLKLLNISLTDYSFMTLILENLAFAGRIREGFSIEDSIYEEQTRCKNINLPFTELEDILGVHFDEKERIWMAFIFMQKRAVSLPEDKVEEPAPMNDITQAFVNKVKEKYGIDFSLAANPLKDLEKHVNSMLCRIELNYHEDSYLAKKIQLDFPYEYEIASEIVSIIYEETQKNITEIEIAYISLHVSLILEALNKPIHALLVSNSSAIMIQRLKNSITKSFYGQIAIDDYTSTHQLDLAVSQLNNIDVIFTTHTIKREVDKPVINLHEIFTHDDWSQIRYFLNQFHHQ